jgi:AcrR family transcriptional regulator
VAVTGKGAQTRRRIIMSAAEVIADRGLAGTNLADVVAQARVTKGALYFHFASKDELILGLEAEYHADSRMMVEEVARDPDPLRRLIRLSFELARRQLRDRLALAHSRLMLSRTQPPLPPPPPTVEWSEVLLGWLQLADVAGRLPPGLDLQVTAEMIDDCVLGVVTASQVEIRRTTMVARVAALWWTVLLPALVPDEQQRDELNGLVEQLSDPEPVPPGGPDGQPVLTGS